MEFFNYGQDRLTASKALAIAKNQLKGRLTGEVRRRIRKSQGDVYAIAHGSKAVYGINTGFGPLCTTRISADDTAKLQENILISHAVGVGEPIPGNIAKLMLILKVHALAQGFSGIQESTIDRVLWHIEEGIVPIVPSQGSVGASGDLAPLSHLFLPLIGLGEVEVEGRVMTAKEALKHFGLEPISLSAKEGLALINGTQFISAYAVEVVASLHNLIYNANIIGAMMVEGLLGSVMPFADELHQLRRYPANQHVAAVIRKLLEQSEVVASHANCTRVQDPYSLRCMPAVHGASLTAWLHLKELLEIELNSVTDNPVVFSEEHTISGGNFHGQPLAMALDYACLAAAEIGNISDRRTYLSLEGDTPGVPKLLLKETGTNSGFMITQYTSAALVSENKGLCFPSSADSIPTSLGQEDHVSMGSISGRKATQVIGNAEKVLGIELFCAAQALDFHAPLKSSTWMRVVHNLVRTQIPFLEEDQLLKPWIDKSIALVKAGAIIDEVAACSRETGESFETIWSSLFDEY